MFSLSISLFRPALFSAGLSFCVAACGGPSRRLLAAEPVIEVKVGLTEENPACSLIPLKRQPCCSPVVERHPADALQLQGVGLRHRKAFVNAHWHFSSSWFFGVSSGQGGVVATAFIKLTVYSKGAAKIHNQSRKILAGFYRILCVSR
jgi:hypothetical protein